MFADKKALVLDMNGVFMFGEDRFGESEDFSTYYNEIGGTLSRADINEIISLVYKYLDKRYLDEKYRHNFPSVQTAIANVTEERLSKEETLKIVDTFAFHEHGHIPGEYIEALFTLREHFVLALVSDIWSPKKAWVETFERLNIDQLFSASSFSSDHGMVKPSPKPFELVLHKLNMSEKECLVIGDSANRDLGGAKSAGLGCILVGGEQDTQAVESFENLLKLRDEL